MQSREGSHMVIRAVRTVMQDAKSRWFFVVFSLGIFLLLFMVPIWTTPGDTVGFHLTILPSWVLVLMIFLSILNGLLLTMQLYIRRVVKQHSIKRTAGESATAFGIISSALAASLACAACYSSVLAVLGLGFTAFVVKYQAYIGVFALFLTFAALYYSAKRVEHACMVCHI